MPEPTTDTALWRQPAAAPRRAAPPRKPVPQLTLRQLESHLWESANILRGKIDSTDFRHYILGLLFYRRLCDVWEEEYDALLERYGDPERASDPTEHRFHLPPHASWQCVRRQSRHIGRHLTAAFRAIEDTNLRLAGLFQDVNFDNSERFPDATLDVLMQHFEKHRLRNVDVEPDVLGNAYEYLIAQFADDAGKKGGEFYTPKQVVRLIVECLEPRAGMSVYDPACGSGGMLLEAVNFVRRRGEDPATLRLSGQEMNLNTWALCQMNLLLHGIDDAQILRGDTLRHPKHLREERRELTTFDRVLANPPFSLKNWGHETWKDGDRYSRDLYGCPPPSYGDLAFLQHMIASLEPNGMLGVVLPHGILFRGGVEAEIRRGLIEEDRIEAIIGLAPNLFYGTSISACVLVIRPRKRAARRGTVLFVDGAAEIESGKNQNFLSEANVERLAVAFHAYRDEPGFARLVGLDEIRRHDYNLYISRYVSPIDGEKLVDTAAEIRTLHQLELACDASEAKMKSLLKELGHKV